MKILVIGTLYEPDLGPSAPLFTMLCKEFVKLGHQVTVITAVPHYPTGQVAQEFRGKWIRRSVESGVYVIRVGLPSIRREKLFERFFQYLCFQVNAVFAARGIQYDVVLAANPFLTVLLPFVFLGVLPRKPIVYSVHDLYPDVGVMLGIFRNKRVIAIVAALERFCLGHSVKVRILSDSFRSGLRALGVVDSKMELIYDWVDTDLIRPLLRNNEFAKEHGLVDRFVVMYAGNIGFSQGMEHILAAAGDLLDKADLQFVIIGDGASLDALVVEAQQRKLSNVLFLPFQPRHRLPEVLASADISLVILRKGIGTGSLPSKTFSILASGRPVIISVDEDSETTRLIRKADAGLCIEPENPMELVNAINLLKQDCTLRERFGCKGRLWAVQMHSPRAAAVQFERLLSKAISIKKSD